VSGGGASSTLPHKQNPIAATRALACARGAHAASTLLRGGEHEHERAVASWHAEWNALSEALAFTGGAAAAVRELLDGLEIDTERMLQNLDASHGLVLAERVSFLLADRLGRREAQQLVADSVAGARANGRSLRDELALDDRVPLSADELDAAFDPTGYLGSAGELVERVLDEYRALVAQEPR
jgi:3-carboxy-cis,cis-muconate cycloisomerase